jgi:hypothetical protein
MGRDRPSRRVVGARRTVVGSSCSWQLSFRREGQKRTRIKALHRELEQVDGTYALVESGSTTRLLHRLNGRGDDGQHAHVHVHASGFHQRGCAYANALPRSLTCHRRESVYDVDHRARARASE